MTPVSALSRHQNQTKETHDHDTYSEIHRHRCEVRYLLRERSERAGMQGSAQASEWLRRYLDGVERSRGKTASLRLREDILQQWKAGNRGAVDEWR